jgi:hypothetical protein
MRASIENTSKKTEENLFLTVIFFLLSLFTTRCLVASLLFFLAGRTSLEARVLVGHHVFRTDGSSLGQKALAETARGSTGSRANSF